MCVQIPKERSSEGVGTNGSVNYLQTNAGKWNGLSFFLFVIDGPATEQISQFFIDWRWLRWKAGEGRWEVTKAIPNDHHTSIKENNGDFLHTQSSTRGWIWGAKKTNIGMKNTFTWWPHPTHIPFSILFRVEEDEVPEFWGLMCKKANSWNGLNRGRKCVFVRMYVLSVIARPLDVERKLFS